MELLITTSTGLSYCLTEMYDVSHAIRLISGCNVTQQKNWNLTSNDNITTVVHTNIPN